MGGARGREHFAAGARRLLGRQGGALLQAVLEVLEGLEGASRQEPPHEPGVRFFADDVMDRHHVGRLILAGAPASRGTRFRRAREASASPAADGPGGQGFLRGGTAVEGGAAGAPYRVRAPLPSRSSSSKRPSTMSPMSPMPSARSRRQGGGPSGRCQPAR
ncbi:hypothetical protein GCM10010446_53680 [Streptomyces enissocaesilis]|uniref:Uncharacterized protein n=1 Tax=Streptomyces enissocaesilis TaxID=332589 RepID=A0ABP6K510_9ACTN